MTPKEKRIVENDLRTLFSLRAFIEPLTFEVLQSLDFFHPEVDTGSGQRRPLSEKGIEALRRITGICQFLPELRDCCSPREIATQVHASYERWIQQKLQPDGEEFVEGVRSTLLACVKERSFLVKLEGLDLDDLDRLDLGLNSICKPDSALLKEIEFNEVITLERIERDFGNSLWLIGKSHGSPEVSRQRFEHRTVLTVGILAVCGTLLYKGAIWQANIRAVISPHQQTGTATMLTWESGGADPSVSRSWGQDKKLPLNSEWVAYLRKECYLDRMAGLIALEERGELQDVIVRALYWFADAHADRNTTMCFIKLWSCAECFFAVTDVEVTERNARGIATVLTFVGYGISTVEEYSTLKTRLKGLYALRSRAIHRAQFGEVQTQDLEDLSRWVAWVIVSMTALNERGYQTLERVKEQIVRLDKLAERNSGKNPERS